MKTGRTGKRKGGRKTGKGLSVRSVLRTALQKEKAAARLYGELAGSIDDASARGLLTDLAAEEKRHVRLVSEITKGRKVPDEKIGGAAADLHIAEFLKPAKLSKRASFQEGCFGSCMCPVMLVEKIRGSFVLRLEERDVVYDDYAVDGVSWTMEYFDGAVSRITRGSIPVLG